MLLIYPKPEEVTGYHPLAMNLESYDEISIFKNTQTNLFHLDFGRQFDGHRSDQSVSYYTLGRFKSAAECLQLFQDIVDALNAGQKTFQLPPSPNLPTQPETADQKGHRGAFL